MNDKHVAMMRALIDIAWTATVVGIMAYAGRRELRAFVSRKRAEIDARTAAVRDAEAVLRNRLGFAQSQRERMIGEEFDA